MKKKIIKEEDLESVLSYNFLDILGILNKRYPEHKFLIKENLKKCLYGVPKTTHPAIINWRITNKCNANCIFCYQVPLKTNDMSLQETKRAAEKISKSKSGIIILSGGGTFNKAKHSRSFAYFN